MRSLGPRLLGFGLLQGALISLAYAPRGLVPESPATAAETLLWSSTGLLLLLAPLAQASLSPAPRHLSGFAVALASFAPATVLRGLLDGVSLAGLAPLLAACAVALLAVRRATRAATPLGQSRWPMMAFWVLLAFGAVAGTRALVFAGALVQVLFPMLLIAAHDSRSRSRANVAAMLLANPFLPGVAVFGLLAVADRWTGAPVPWGILDGPVLATAVIASWLLPGAILTVGRAAMAG